MFTVYRIADGLDQHRNARFVGVI